MTAAEERIAAANAPRDGDFAGYGPAHVVNLTASHRTHWTADELMLAEFPEPRWAVPGLIAEGVTLLAGPPKLGKSWLVLNVALAIASGGVALGRLPVDQGDVLYLALEDTPRRLQRRLASILGRDTAPRALEVATRCPTITNASGALIDWCDRHPNARLIVVDVLTRLRDRHSDDHTSRYDADYAIVSTLKRLADMYTVPMVLVHHTRKMGSDDFAATVSGTHGLAGAADAVAVMARARASTDAVLSITGRDVEEAEYALRFAPQVGTWTLLDETPAELALTEERRRLLDAVRELGFASPSELAKHLGISHDSARQSVRRALNAGQLVTDGSGQYSLPPANTPSHPSPLSHLDRDNRDGCDTPLEDGAA